MSLATGRRRRERPKEGQLRKKNSLMAYQASLEAELEEIPLSAVALRGLQLELHPHELKLLVRSDRIATRELARIAEAKEPEAALRKAHLILETATAILQAPWRTSASEGDGHTAKRQKRQH